MLRTYIFQLPQMKIKLELCHFFKNKLTKDIIEDIFERAFFKPNTKDELKEAVKLWISDEDKAFNKYGHISFWNTSLITDMSYMFISAKNFYRRVTLVRGQ